MSQNITNEDKNALEVNLSSHQILRIKRIKAFVSRQLWRMRKSSSVINLFFYSLTLSGIYLPYIAPLVPIPGSILLIILYCISFAGILLLGFLYDAVFRLWKEDNIVEINRNPFHIDKFTDKEIQTMKIRLSNFHASYESMRTNMLICHKLNIPCDELEEQLIEIKKKIDLFEEWIAHGYINRKA